MDSQGTNKLICEVCQKKFTSVSTKNRHMKNFHNKPLVERKSKHILCPLCPEEEKEFLGCHEDLKKHLTQVHSVDIKESLLHFRNLEEFESWRRLENREVDYVCQRKEKGPRGYKYIYYNCNRSDTKGFASTCEKRRMKCGGTIRIAGICPSRMFVKILENGTVTVKFVQTHVGHGDELRTKRLTKREKEIIVEQLNAGVTKDKIIQDARKIKNGKVERINIISRVDLAYLTRKYNIDKKRDESEAQKKLEFQLKSTPKSFEVGKHFKNKSLELGKFQVEDPDVSCVNEKNQNTNMLLNFEERREIELREMLCYIKTLEEKSFDKFMHVFGHFKNNFERKRKMESQLYYPKKK